MKLATTTGDFGAYAADAIEAIERQNYGQAASLLIAAQQETEEMYMDEDDEDLYVTSLSFIQEPELGEGSNAADLSNYPMEDILDRFYCHISDFYNDLNKEDSQICYLEFGSPELQDVVNLRSIIGKHVYNREEGDRVELVIE